MERIGAGSAPEPGASISLEGPAVVCAGAAGGFDAAGSSGVNAGKVAAKPPAGPAFETGECHGPLGSSADALEDAILAVPAHRVPVTIISASADRPSGEAAFVAGAVASATPAFEAFRKGMIGDVMPWRRSGIEAAASLTAAVPECHAELFARGSAGAETTDAEFALAA